MTVITAGQLADFWVAHYGPANRAVEFVAIAMAESSLHTEAVSNVGALGTWQIMPFWFPDFGYTTDEYQNQDIQAQITVAISGSGTNCAAWDTCYLDINRSGRYTFLGWPEEGSAAFANIPVAQAEIGLGTVNGPGHDRYPGVTATLPATLADFSALSGKHMPQLALTVARQQARISRQFYPRMP